MSAKIATLSLIGPELVRKIESIKAVRGLAGLGLKESKELVEDLENGSRTIHILSSNSDEEIFKLVEMGRNGGIRISLLSANNPVRRSIADEIKKIVTYSTMTGQYDIVKGLINILETNLSFIEDEIGELPKEEVE